MGRRRTLDLFPATSLSVGERAGGRVDRPRAEAILQEQHKKEGRVHTRGRRRSPELGHTKLWWRRKPQQQQAGDSDGAVKRARAFLEIRERWRDVCTPAYSASCLGRPRGGRGPGGLPVCLSAGVYSTPVDPWLSGCSVSASYLCCPSPPQPVCSRANRPAPRARDLCVCAGFPGGQQR